MKSFLNLHLLNSKSNQPFNLLVPLCHAATTTAVLFVLFYLIFLSGGTSGWTNPLLLAAAVGAWLLFRKHETGMEVPLLGFAAALLVTALLSIDPFRSLGQWQSIAAGLLIVLMAAALVQGALSARRLVGIVLALGGLYMAWAWWDAARWYQSWLAAAPGQWIPQISFRLNGSNNVAAYFNVLIFTSLAFLGSSRSWGGRLGWGAYLLSAFGLLVLSSSRGGWVGAGVGGLALAGLWLAQSPQSFRDRVRNFLRLRSFWIMAVVDMVVFIGIGYWLLTVFDNHPTHGAALASRSEFWPAAWQGFLQSPLWGNGINTYPSFQMQIYSYPPTPIYFHAHNQYLDILLGSGLLGAAAFAWLLLSLVKALWRNLSEKSLSERALIRGAMAALAAYMAHGIFDGLYRMPFASFSLMLILGAGLARPQPLRRWARASGLGLGLAGVFIALLFAWWSAPMAAGVQLAAQGEYQRAYECFAQAAQRAPVSAVAYQQQGLAESVLAVDDRQHLQPAISAFERAAALDPTWGLNWANLGALYREAGSLDQAAQVLQQSVRAAPKAALFWLNLGEVEELRGNQEQAQQAYQTTLQLRPAWVSAYFWRVTPLRSAAARQAQAALNEDPTEDLPASYAIYFLRKAETERAGGNLAAAEFDLKKASLAYFRTEEDRLEFAWQKAEQAAAIGAYQAAVQQGEQAAGGFLTQSVYGPGTYGVINYAQAVFGVPAMPRDLTPQLTNILINDAWGQRLGMLSEWTARLGNQARADELRTVLQSLIPDF